MPAVIFTCTKAWCPPIITPSGVDREKPTTKQTRVIELMRSIPDLLVKHAAGFCLSTFFDAEDVLVNHTLFGYYAINAPDIWIKFFFEDQMPPKPLRMYAQESIQEIVETWAEENPITQNVVCKLDLNWGSSCGISMRLGPKSIIITSWA